MPQLMTSRMMLLASLAGCVGCAGGPQASEKTLDAPMAIARPAESSDTIAIEPKVSADLEETGASIRTEVQHSATKTVASGTKVKVARCVESRSETSSVVRVASLDQRSETPRLMKAKPSVIIASEPLHQPSNGATSTSAGLTTGTLTINGRQYEMKLVEPDQTLESDDHPVGELAVFQGPLSDPESVVHVSPIPMPISGDSSEQVVELSSEQLIEPNILDLNLPSALAMIGGDHPVVGFAQWRVQEAYAELQQAKVLWLPSIQAGFSFHRHDGNYQASDATVVDVNRNSFQYGFGTGATGAGTTPRPGLVARFHLADAIFRPKTAEKTAWARGHAAKATLNTQLLSVAQAYTELVGAHQDQSILNETRELTTGLLKLTSDFAEAGEGLQADSDRMQTEVALVETRLSETRERIAVASARLAHAISLDAAQQILPMDVIAVPVDLVSAEMDRASLIGTGLATRPELCESQALVAAACEAYRREKYAPFVPSILLGLSTGGFGGGFGNQLDDVDSRYDIDAVMSWEIRNLGLGEQAARRRSSARIQQAKYAKLQVMDRVAREVSESYGRVQLRRERMEIAQRAILSAEDSYRRNLERIQDGQGLPLEVLQSLQALEQTRRAYAQAVIDHNQSQFQLQWSLGWPVHQ